MRCFLSLPTEQNLKKAWISPRSPFHGSMGSTTQKGVGNRLRLSGVGSSPGPRVLQSLVHPLAPIRGDWCTVLTFNLMSLTLTRNKYLLLTGGSNMSCWHHEARLNQPWVGLRAKAAKQTKTSVDSCLVSWASGLLLAIVDGKNPAPFKTYIANKNMGYSYSLSSVAGRISAISNRNPFQPAHGKSLYHQMTSWYQRPPNNWFSRLKHITVVKHAQPIAIIHQHVIEICYGYSKSTNLTHPQNGTSTNLIYYIQHSCQNMAW